MQQKPTNPSTQTSSPEPNSCGGSAQAAAGANTKDATAPADQSAGAASPANERPAQPDPHLIAAPIALTRQLEQLVDKRINILRRIRETGSISEAARLANVSYKAAWQAIETLGNLAGAPLVQKAVGGTRGGGTALTPTGLTVLELAEKLAQAREKVFEEFASSALPQLMPVGATTLRTSMRNQFPVTVTKITRGAAMVHLTLEIDAENTLRATLTQESAQLLGITTGSKILALCKATAIEIAREVKADEKTPVLRGTVVRSSRNDKGGEVTIRLAGGTSLVGFSRAGHGLHLGDEAQAAVSPQSVVVALFT